MKNGFKLALVTLPIAAIGAGFLAYLVTNSAPPSRVEISERASPVRVIIAETHAITPTVKGFGLVAPLRTFEAIAEVGGTVEYLNPALRGGQILPEGAVLLRLSPTDFNLAIAQAQANIRAAEARLDELEVSEANQRAALEIEQEVMAVKTADLERADALFATGTMTQSARDSVRALHLAQRQKVQGIEGGLALFPTQRAVQVEQIAVYQTNLATAQLNLERSELTLPFTARVAAHNVEVGQFLKAGQTAATLDGIDRAEVEVQVPLGALRPLMFPDASKSAPLSMEPTQLSEALGQMGLGARVQLRLGSEFVTWPARIDRISDGIDLRTGTVGVVVQVEAAYAQSGDDNRPPLAKGMFVEVTLSAPKVSGIVVPRSALHTGQIHVADADDRLRFVDTNPQLVQGEIALISDAIPKGTRIVLSTPSPVVDGLLLDPHLDQETVPRLLAEEAEE